MKTINNMRLFFIILSGFVGLSFFLYWMTSDANFLFVSTISFCVMVFFPVIIKLNMLLFYLSRIHPELSDWHNLDYDKLKKDYDETKRKYTE